MIKRHTAGFILAALLMSVISVCAADTDWICGKCGAENTGNFCVRCGQPRETPEPISASPIPAPASSPTPVPAPETWRCIHCDGINDRENAFCGYCGSPKTASDPRSFAALFAPLYRGMNEREVIDAFPNRDLYHGVRLLGFKGWHVFFFFYHYDGDGGLSSVSLTASVDEIDMEKREFVACIEMTFGTSGWTIENGMCTKDSGGVNLSYAAGEERTLNLRIVPQLDWSSIRKGRETVRRERYAYLDGSIELTGYRGIKAAFETGLAPVMGSNLLWGYVNTEGDLVIECQYNGASAFENGFATVGRYVGSEYRKGIINSEGKTIVPIGQYDDVSTFAEGFCWVRSHGKWGCIDTEGRMVIEARYDAACNFGDGLAAVKTGGRWGAVDQRGREVIPPVFESGFIFREGIACVKHGDRYMYIGKSGEQLFGRDFAFVRDFSEGLAVCDTQFIRDQDGNYRFEIIDRDGMTRFFLTCSNAAQYHEGVMPFARDGLVGLADTEGAEAAAPVYSGIRMHLNGSGDGFFAARKDDKWGMIDKYGHVIIPFEYDDLYPFNEGYCIAVRENTVTIIRQPE